MLRSILSPCLIAAAAILITGCAATGSSRPTRSVSDSAELGAGSIDASDAKAELVSEIDRWLGTKYRYGGTGASGFDCSGFVRRVIRDAFDESLPRTTRAQMRVGSEVSRSELKVADLVFFLTPARSDHVGVYLGQGEFAHASSSSGVMISHLGEPYWSKSYRTARRLIQIDGDDSYEHSSVQPVAPEANRLATVVSKSTRVGW